jgi:prevent-host-death family protein
MGNPLKLYSGAEMVSHNISELQSKYSVLVEEALSGKDVAIVKRGKNVVALQSFDKYLELQNEAGRARELDVQVQQLQARLDLLLAGGPSLQEVRESPEDDDMDAAGFLAELQAERNATK